MKAILRLGAGAVIGLVLILSLTLTAVAVLPARAQDLRLGECMPYPVLVEQLADRYGEKIFFFGETLSEAVRAQVAASPDGTWTVFLVDVPKGEACVLLFGRAWAGENLPAQGEEL